MLSPECPGLVWIVVRHQQVLDILELDTLSPLGAPQLRQGAGPADVDQEPGGALADEVVVG